ncbi:hypothetical protein EOD39_10800 [Acipenser ruthenus]|uniref:Uncharacterized protein n=1 Tax=Acipenser ruthenus TaxID=7906 RepID=A0A444TWY8_ACIRT|nr:hypothetical protein EOD39_10800 [Acipenser ruthenus]
MGRSGRRKQQQQVHQQQRGAGRKSRQVSAMLDVCLTCLKGLLQRQGQQAEYRPRYPDMETWLCNPDCRDCDSGSDDKESKTANGPAS